MNKTDMTVGVQFVRMNSAGNPMYRVTIATAEGIAMISEYQFSGAVKMGGVIAADATSVAFDTVKMRRNVSFLRRFPTSERFNLSVIPLDDDKHSRLICEEITYQLQKSIFNDSAVADGLADIVR